MNSTLPLVSITCITYNHEEYVAQALDGFLSQKTTFPVEIIVGDDCSTDKTKNIIFKYQKKYPHKIKLITSKNNVGMKKNSLRTRATAQGKYIAFCEGDDYWTDSLKLQKQFDYLEAHPDFSCCFHDVIDLNLIHNTEIKHSAIYKDIIKKRDVFTTEDILKDNFIPTLSVMFRNSNIEIPSIFGELLFGDWTLHVLNSLKGKIKYLPDVMGVYRIHSKGMWSSKSIADKEMSITQFYFSINKFTNNKYYDLITDILVKKTGAVISYQEDLIEARDYYKTQLSNSQEQFKQSQKQLKRSQELLAQITQSFLWKLYNKIWKIRNLLFKK
jgi:glycosyltransferase involved in cell wall biosynthesis